MAGCCSETKEKLVMYKGKLVCAEETERLLCFEYMPKGNLRGYLLDESSGLDWGLRYKIIEGICSGLHYLHEEWQVGTPIIHMDLKPANILLDENMVPKIADFGLARLFGEEQTRTCTKSCEGTVGYMAPEYINRAKLSRFFMNRKSDREGKLFTSFGPAASLDTLNTLDPAEPNNPLAIKDGKMLASAGVEKKAVLWNLEAFEKQYTSEEHRLVIADVSFRPKSTQLATSSFDRTIKLWNTADPKFSLHTFTGHPHQVVSLDFHPTKTDLLCSCDAFGEIRYWNVNRLKCERTMKGADCRVRFQPNAGRFLAAADANENVVSVFDIETHKRTYALQGHGEWMQSLCWDNSGKYLATVSPHQVKVWSISSGECIHELTSNGKEFHSCVFHPGYANLFLIGGHQTLDIWNMVNNQSITVRAHEGLVATLAQSPVNGIVASASYDYSVKLWK
ncbi:hypothetical protein QOZ80_1AG0009880 [Eleusine coracana subsp. coracana]|nr:hypothetical protein QOZ80_1AG0009880 [Eleusine coracana subsp. coracana]